MRLDVAVSEQETMSRTKAKDLIIAGEVFVNDHQILTPSYLCSLNDRITVKKKMYQFVSRSGYKLLEAFTKHSISADHKVCLDIGASTGGFTDCLLQFRAKHVVALDVGTLQLDPTLRDDSRITLLENTNAKYIGPQDFEQKFDLVVMDVSFISIKAIFDRIQPLLQDAAELFILIKPQFEVGPNHINKHGIVKNARIIDECIQDFRIYFKQSGYQIRSIDPCSVLGRGGNQEFMAYLTYHLSEDGYATTNHR